MKERKASIAVIDDSEITVTKSRQVTALARKALSFQKR
jgi:hypothetical protein